MSLASDPIAVRGEALGERRRVGREEPPDLLQRHLQRPQAPDRNGSLDLRRVVVAIAGVRVDVCWSQEVDPLVVAEGVYPPGGCVCKASDSEHGVQDAGSP